MKIGIFDSGLGGLIVAKAIRKMMPQYDYVYLGDTKRVPYGNRSHEAVFEFTKQGVDYLFRKENCAIVIVACNTASARALRRLQKEYLPTLTPSLRQKSKHSPFAGGEKRKILGVLIPAAEESVKYKRVGILATLGTVSSGTFPREILKLNKSRRLKGSGPRPNASGNVKVFQNPAPMLVPLAEEGEIKNALPFIKKYLQQLIDKSRRPKGSGPRPNASGNLDALVLGCTHYPIFKKEIKKMISKNTKVISQDEIVPKKLKNYFARHPEIEKQLSRNKTAKILFTDMTQTVSKITTKWFGKQAKPKLVRI